MENPLSVPAPFYRYWGKASPASPDGPLFHRLVYHCLDVGACADLLLERDARFTNRIAELCDCDANELRRFLVFLIILHDVGKFAQGFQNQAPDVRDMLYPNLPSGVYGGPEKRHDSLGYLALRDVIIPALDADLRINVNERALAGLERRDLLQPWLAAVAGHHGRPPFVARSLARREMALPQRDDAIAFARAVITLLEVKRLSLRRQGPLETLLGPTSWIVAGFTILADWLGSNDAFFPYVDHIMPIPDYWDLAKQRAGHALAEAEVLPAVPRRATSIQSLFEFIEEPTPMQRWAADLPIASLPQLHILEDLTGSGKTEAALMLAHRLMANGRGDGVYIGLPTMATANAMYDRLAKEPEARYRRFFDPGSNIAPSLILAHSARHLRKLLVPKAAARAYYAPGEPTTSVHCSQWLADGRKRALLTDFGVGTVDQALLGVLPSKHSPLRLLGVHRKILIVDEVHAYDAYTSTLLDRLLEFHANLGGSAILLSATLPSGMKRRLMQAFAKGVSPNASQAVEYPLATSCCARGSEHIETPIASRVASDRATEFVFVSTVEAALAVIVEAAARGRCAVWIRNTVDDAIEACQRLREQLSRDQVALFHARLMLGHRLAIESSAIARFGKTGGAKERSGQVLVATQVVEQSLDIDFDALVTDLAPIDLLVQRIGRQHRHRRDTHGNIAEQDSRPQPVAHVLAPEYTDAPPEAWLADSATPSTRFVYRDQVILWRTMRAVHVRRMLRLPADARNVVEEVYASEDTPPALQESLLSLEGDTQAATSMASYNALSLDAGYGAEYPNWYDEGETPTRLGDETVRLRLVEATNGANGPLVKQVAPYGGRGGWFLSDLSVRLSKMDLGALQAEAEVLAELSETMPDGGRFVYPIRMLEQGGGTWRSAVPLTRAGEHINYHTEQGLTFKEGGTV